jgi:LysM repeat protein/energy-converting hydrogenase Eha subunit A
MTKHLTSQARLLGSCVVVLSLAAIVASGLGAPPSAEASPARQSTTTVAITPATVQLACAATQVIQIRINDVTDLYGVDVRLTYNPAVVEVVDANTSAPGVQIASGDLPDVGSGNGYVQVNSVDVDTGTISYAAIRINPAPAQSGSGTIASVTFRGKAAGTSPVTLVSVVLSDATAKQITALPVSGQITVTCQGTPAPTATTPATAPAPTKTATPVVPPPTAAPPQPSPVPGNVCRHVIRPGDTLYSIARTYGTTVYAIQAANHIANPDYIVAGQSLTIPGCTPGHETKPPAGGCSSYVVMPGDTLSGIAMKKGDCVTTLAYRNGIVNPNLIFAGQRLTVCPGCTGGPGPGPAPSPTCRATHVVAPYETLIRISLYYRTSVQAIQAVNAIANPNLIYAGQTLCIP